MSNIIVLLLIILLVAQQRRAGHELARRKELEGAKAELAKVKAELHQLQLLADYIRNEDFIKAGNIGHVGIYNWVRRN